LTACGAIAIFGARRPAMGAWNFVVGGLLLILLFPLLQQPWNDTGWRVDGLHAAFLAILLTAVLGNFLTAGSVHFWLPLGCSSGLELAAHARRWRRANAGGVRPVLGLRHVVQSE
jgi:hypothetical protein